MPGVAGHVPCVLPPARAAWAERAVSQPAHANQAPSCPLAHDLQGVLRSSL